MSDKQNESLKNLKEAHKHHIRAILYTGADVPETADKILEIFEEFYNLKTEQAERNGASNQFSGYMTETPSGVSVEACKHERVALDEALSRECCDCGRKLDVNTNEQSDEVSELVDVLKLIQRYIVQDDFHTASKKIINCGFTKRSQCSKTERCELEREALKKAIYTCIYSNYGLGWNSTDKIMEVIDAHFTAPNVKRLSVEEIAQKLFLEHQWQFTPTRVLNWILATKDVQDKWIKIAKQLHQRIYGETNEQS